MTLVHYTLEDDVAVVRMDDGKVNAISYALIEELDAALDRATKEAKALVLTGRPGVLSAGFDLKTMMSGLDAARALVRRGGELILRLYLHPQPLVVAASGHALAGGALVLLTGDVRLATEGKFRVGLNEVAIGMPLPVLGMELVRDRVERRFFTRSTLFAQVFEPSEALEAGWVDAVVPEDELAERALAEARRLASLPKEAYALTKTIQREKTVNYIRATIDLDMARLSVPRA